MVLINGHYYRDEPTQMAALKIVQGMVQHHTLTLEQTSSILPLITGFGSHPSQPCRIIMYDTLITLYNNYRYVSTVLVVVLFLLIF